MPPSFCINFLIFYKINLMKNIKKSSEGVTTPKMFQHDVVYAFTLNPKDSLQGNQDLNVLERTKKFTKIITTIRKLFDDYDVDYMLYPEISTPEPYRIINRTNIIPRLHYHGYIRFTDPALFYCHTYIQIAKRIGIFKIKSIDDHKKWNDYIKKDRKVMKKIMHSLKLPYKLRHGKFDTIMKLAGGLEAASKSKGTM